MDRKVVMVVNAGALPSELLQPAAATFAEFRQVTNGEQATAMAHAQPVSAAIISHELPDMPCEKLLRMLNAAPHPVPAIVVAGAPSSDEIIAVFRAGARDFVSLPACPGELYQRVQQLLAGSATVSNGHFSASSYKGQTVHHPGSAFTNHLLNRPVRLVQHLFKSMTTALPFSNGWCHRSDGVKTSFTGHNGERVYHDGEFNETAVKQPQPQSASDDPSVTTLPEDTGYLFAPERIPRNDSLSNASIQVYALGKFRVVIDGKAIEKWPSRKGRGIFAYMALHSNRRIHKDVLMENFWPEAAPSSARNSLNVALHGVRRALQQVGPNTDHILFQGECYYMNPAVEIWLDVEEFTRCWRSAQAAERRQQQDTALSYYLKAAQLGRGDFMEDEPYENWAACERDNLRERYLFVVDKLTRHYVQRGCYSEAIPWCEAALAKDCCREDIHRRLMRCYQQSGKRSLAMRQFQKCCAALRQELEAGPAAATVRLFDEIRRGLKKNDDATEN